jgi:hypothetical protein
MYVKSLHLYNFKCFAKAALDLRYPGERDALDGFSNINLVLGDNGGGKSSVLRAVAIAALAPAIIGGGFVPYRLVRRAAGLESPSESLVKIRGVLSSAEAAQAATPKRSKRKPKAEPEKTREFLARLVAGPRGEDRLHLESTPRNPVDELLHDSFSPAFFIVGYGATRRVEGRGYSPESASRSRGRRYQRIASLFEDSVALRPMHSWLPRQSRRLSEVVDILNATMPPNMRFEGRMDDTDDYVFTFDGVETPFQSLSDGYRAFIGWMGDLLGHMCEVCPDGMDLRGLEGIVLVDEIDLHLHPGWQLSVVGQLANALPKIQFVFTSHSPLIANTVHRQNVHVTGLDADGLPTIGQLDESLYGRGAEGVLLSPYFGLESTRPLEVREKAAQAARAVAAGMNDGKPSKQSITAALDFMKQLTNVKQPENAG